MTVFERSPDGISNRALFLGVDIVAYHEGNSTDDISLDTLFWNNVFECFRPDLKVRFLPSGGKTDILEILKGAPEENRNSLFLLDRDYDDICGDYIDRSDVLYTYGYSFENDIFSKELIDYFIYNQLPIAERRQQWNQEIMNYFEDTDEILRTIAKFDQMSRKINVGGIATDGFQRLYTDGRLGGKPTIAEEIVEIEQSRISQNLQENSHENVDGNWQRRINGHFLMDISYRMVVFLARKLDSRFSVEKKFLIRAFLSRSFNSIDEADERAQYFDLKLRYIFK
ncbi:DUF4435 domain-containing protein [Rhizobium sp. BT-226]|uniref:DUF4435 domain-containing protein n=1 Tax=Rhizobium sp. BT-226 TaxID=2986922 RepID=UPI0021F7EACB|nr:DUF4435 domain-containing protein [Rhizobium sp. BT-226]MCW0015822.1 DUF4435 domain-containing protein [Rhizobium sp. BT-226]